MGDDGADGMVQIRRSGGVTIAESAETCVVFGMPRAAAELGAVSEVASLDEMAPRLLRALEAQAVARRSRPAAATGSAS